MPCDGRRGTSRTRPRPRSWTRSWRRIQNTRSDGPLWLERAESPPIPSNNKNKKTTGERDGTGRGRGGTGREEVRTGPDENGTGRDGTDGTRRHKCRFECTLRLQSSLPIAKSTTEFAVLFNIQQLSLPCIFGRQQSHHSCQDLSLFFFYSFS